MLQRLVGSLPDTLSALAGPQGRASDEEPPALPGYAPAGRIDAGGMGVVWRVHDLQFRRCLAVKVMKSWACASPGLVERFIAEARVCGQLAHPSIVPVHAMGRLPDGRPYYAMKLVEGQTLAALLEVGPAAAERRMNFVQVFGQVCQAVAFAHGRGVIHRDLKPKNVMVGTHGEVQLMDWGLAKELTSDTERRTDVEMEASVVTTFGDEESNRTRADSVLGTLTYMPPEQARGLVAEVDRRSDVFGLGAILCEILTGEPPYSGPDVEAVRLRAAEADLAEALERLRGCGADPELVLLAERCLAPRKADRPADAGEVAAAVAAYLTGVEERLQQERLERERHQVQAAGERHRRKLWMGLTVAVLVAVGLAVGGWQYWRGQRAQRHQEASRALALADRQLRGGEFVAAKESLTRAQDRLGDDGPLHLTREYDRLQSAWQLVQDLKRIEQTRSTPTDEGSFDNDAAQKSYESTFARAGYDLTGGDPIEVAGRVSRSPVTGPILEAIDNWALVCAYDILFVPKHAEEYRLRRDRLLAVARAVDPDPAFRDKIRSPNVWDDLRQLEALAKQAIRTDLSPRLAALLAELVRRKKGNPEQLLRTFQSRYPDDFWLNFDLAKRLDMTNPIEALQFYQAALAVRPHHIVVQSHIGLNSRRRRDWDEAIAVFKRALARLPEDDPLSVSLRNNLAAVLMDKEDILGAVSLFCQNVRIRPNLARTHLNLGRCFTRLGRFADALQSFRRGLAVATETASPHRGLAEREVREAERRLELDRQLAAGKPNPASAVESLAFAEIAHCKMRFADAVEFYRRGFEQEPKMAADLDGGIRYSAACAAALAAAGREEATEPLGTPQRAEMRKQALSWLREDLDAWSRRANDPKARRSVEAELRHWKGNPNLANLRDPTAVAQLPNDEQQVCKQFWADVNALLSKVLIN